MLTNILLRTPARSIDDVVGVMTAIDDALPDDDGLKWFNRLYLRVTVSVRKAVEGATFRDPEFLAALDVVFANLYFAALTAAETAAPARRPRGGRCSTRGTWAASRGSSSRWPEMNAHINRDLPEGIVQAFTMLGGDPLTDSGRRQDFDSINALLERIEQDVRADFGRHRRRHRRARPRRGRCRCQWKVRSARAAAWTNAKVMWRLRDPPRVDVVTVLHDEFFERLDGPLSPPPEPSADAGGSHGEVFVVRL